MDMGPRVDERYVGVDEGVETRFGFKSGGGNVALSVGHGKLEARTSDGSQETTLVAEVDIRRLVANTDPLRHLADTELLGWVCFEQFQCGRDEPTGQICRVRRHPFRFD